MVGQTWNGSVDVHSPRWELQIISAWFTGMWDMLGYLINGYSTLGKAIGGITPLQSRNSFQ